MHRRSFLHASAAALGLGALDPQRALAWTERAPRFPRTQAIPSPHQLAWQRDELAIFVHFGVNTFTDREWGDGKEDPRIFNPTGLDARQWARPARAGGFRLVVLTAKHHDGFCLWPTRTTAHSVRGSAWKGGRGDVVREFVDAARAEGLKVGLYLSPWDQNAPAYGDTVRYNHFYIDQLTELLTWYGPIAEVWFDGAKGKDASDMQYDWPRIHRTVRQLQPEAVIFSDAGPDVRWIGNERGIAGDPNWSTVDPRVVPYPGMSGPGIIEALQHGHPGGAVWRPGEADVSIRPGWFWHPGQDDKVRSADNLTELYFLSVGRNANLLLNVPPTSEGIFHPTDVRRLAELRQRLDRIFATDLARTARVGASGAHGRDRNAERVIDGDPDSYWSPGEGVTTGSLELVFPRPVTFDVISLQEAIRHGQSVERFSVHGWAGGRWTLLTRGTTIGHKRLERIAPTTTDRVRVVIDSALDVPRISSVALYGRG
jgi:alpha-L-fucosidase